MLKEIPEPGGGGEGGGGGSYRQADRARQSMKNK